MKQQVEVTMTLTMWLDADMDEESISVMVRDKIYHVFDENIMDVNDPLDIVDIREEAEIYASDPVEVISSDKLTSVPINGREYLIPNHIVHLFKHRGD